jgi:hypothetical protein
MEIKVAIGLPNQPIVGLAYLFALTRYIKASRTTHCHRFFSFRQSFGTVLSISSGALCTPTKADQKY